MANLATGYSEGGVGQTYTTVAAAFAAAAADGSDNIQPYYSNASVRRFWAENISSNTTKAVSMEGMLTKRQLVFYTYAAANFYYLSGDLSGVNTQLVLQNFNVMAPENKYIFLWNDTTGGGAGMRVTNVVGVGGFMFFRHLAGDANCCQVDNCCTVSAEYAIYPDRPTYVYYNTCIGSRITGIDGRSVASTIKNNACMWSGGQDFNGMGSATASNNLSSDATGSAGLQNVTTAQFAGWPDTNGSNFGMFDWRITADSTAYQAGTPIGGITTDCDGNTRDVSTPSIGWHEGTASAYPGLGGGLLQFSKKAGKM